MKEKLQRLLTDKKVLYSGVAVILVIVIITGSAAFLKRPSSKPAIQDGTNASSEAPSRTFNDDSFGTTQDSASDETTAFPTSEAASEKTEPSSAKPQQQKPTTDKSSGQSSSGSYKPSSKEIYNPGNQSIVSYGNDRVTAQTKSANLKNFCYDANNSIWYFKGERWTGTGIPDPIYVKQPDGDYRYEGYAWGHIGPTKGADTQGKIGSIDIDGVIKNLTAFAAKYGIKYNPNMITDFNNSEGGRFLAECFGRLTTRADFENGDATYFSQGWNDSYIFAFKEQIVTSYGYWASGGPASNPKDAKILTEFCMDFEPTDDGYYDIYIYFN